MNQQVITRCLRVPKQRRFSHRERLYNFLIPQQPTTVIIKAEYFSYQDKDNDM